MNSVDNTRYATFLIKFKFAWKINKSLDINLLENDVNYYIKEAISEISEKYNFSIEELIIGERYVSLCIKSLPKYAPSEIINKIKGITGRRICLNKNIKKVWDRGYFCFTEGQDDVGLLENYLKEK